VYETHPYPRCKTRAQYLFLGNIGGRDLPHSLDLRHSAQGHCAHPKFLTLEGIHKYSVSFHICNNLLPPVWSDCSWIRIESSLIMKAQNRGRDGDGSDVFIVTRSAFRSRHARVVAAAAPGTVAQALTGAGASHRGTGSGAAGESKYPSTSARLMCERSGAEQDEQSPSIYPDDSRQPRRLPGP